MKKKKSGGTKRSTPSDRSSKYYFGVLKKVPFKGLSVYAKSAPIVKAIETYPEYPNTVLT